MLPTHPTTSRLRRSGLTRTVAAAAVASAAALVTANAAIVYSGVVNTAQSAPSDGTFSRPINLDNLSTVEFTLNATADNSKGGNQSATYISAFGSGFKPVADSPTGATITKLSLGQAVTASSIFTTASSNGGIARFHTTVGGTLTWAASDVGYMGFTFNPTGSTPLYGWAQMGLSADRKTITMVDYAWENAGASIITGAVPEPTAAALGVLGLGAHFLGRRRPRVSQA